ncbi:MAG: hypothetical protein HY360_16815 [Verrucomicrobia bacterium]|nr:hypothetical protein [Verrucomicrobiota bacterium]
MPKNLLEKIMSRFDNLVAEMILKFCIFTALRHALPPKLLAATVGAQAGVSAVSEAMADKRRKILDGVDCVDEKTGGNERCLNRKN